MSGAPRGRAPICYEIRVLGHLDPLWSTWFTGLALTQEDDGTTSLRGMVTDQTELHGLIAKVRDLGATLVSVVPVDAAEPTPDHPSSPAEQDRPDIEGDPS